jgi:hypothetical protein
VPLDALRAEPAVQRLVEAPDSGVEAAIDHPLVGAGRHADLRLFGDMQVFGLERAAFCQVEPPRKCTSVFSSCGRNTDAAGRPACCGVRLLKAKLRWFLALR